MNVTIIEDNDGDWFWIPNDQVGEFTVRSNQISGLDYMENPDLFDTFNEKYAKYATGGDSQMCPDIFIEDMEQELDANMKLISDFMSHYEKETGNEMPEDIFLSFFNA